MLWDDDSNETGVATDRAFLGQFEARAFHTSLQGNRSHICSRPRRSCAMCVCARARVCVCVCVRARTCVRMRMRMHAFVRVRAHVCL